MTRTTAAEAAAVGDSPRKGRAGAAREETRDEGLRPAPAEWEEGLCPLQTDRCCRCRRRWKLCRARSTANATRQTPGVQPSQRKAGGRSKQMVKLQGMRKWTSVQYLERVSTRTFDGSVQMDSSNLYVIKTLEKAATHSLGTSSDGKHATLQGHHSTLQNRRNKS